MKKTLTAMLVLSLLAGCTGGPQKTANDPVKETATAEKKMPITLNEFTDHYNAVLADSSDIAQPIDPDKKENGQIKVDDQVTIKLNKDDSFAGVQYEGPYDMTIPSLILDSLGVRDDQAVNEMLAKADEAATDGKTFSEEAAAGDMDITIEYQDETFLLKAEGN